MSRETYINGFCKIAKEFNVDSNYLFRFAYRNALLKKAESKAFIHDLKNMVRMKKNAQQNVPQRPSDWDNRWVHGRPVSSIPGRTNLPPSPAPKKTIITTKSPAHNSMITYDRYKSEALKRGWKYNNGAWISPNGTRYTDKDIKKRISLKNGVRYFNSTAGARRAAVGKLPSSNTDIEQRKNYIKGIKPNTDLEIDALTSSPKEINATVNGQKVVKYNGKSGFWVQPKNNFAAYNYYGDNLVQLGKSKQDSLPVIMGNKIYYYRNGKLVQSGNKSININGSTVDNYGNFVRRERSPIRMTRARAEAIRRRRNGFTI